MPRFFSQIDLQLPPNPGPHRWHSQDGHHYPFWTVGNPLHAIWPEEHSTDVPTTHGYSTSEARLLFCVHWWHLGSHSLQGWVQNPPTAGVSMPKTAWSCAQFSQVPIWQERDWFHCTSHHKHSITPLLSKIVAIKEFTKPSTVQRLQEFLGMVNFYHHFIPSAANTVYMCHAAIVPSYCREAQTATVDRG